MGEGVFAGKSFFSVYPAKQMVMRWTAKPKMIRSPFSFALGEFHPASRMLLA